MQFLILGPSSLPIVVAQPDESHANRTAWICVGVVWQTQSVQYLV